MSYLTHESLFAKSTKTTNIPHPSLPIFLNLSNYYFQKQECLVRQTFKQKAHLSLLKERVSHWPGPQGSA